MGLFGKLFGKPREDAAGQRCMECGMASGAHTGWCPRVAADEDVDAGAPAGRGTAGEREMRDAADTA